MTHPEVDGVWTANDDMAMGAIQALKEAGLAGKALVCGCDGIPEMLAAIKSGLAAATMLNDGKYQAQLGLAMSLAATQRKLDVQSLPHNYRQFEIPAANVNRENVNQVMHDYLEATPAYDLSDFRSVVVSNSLTDSTLLMAGISVLWANATRTAAVGYDGLEDLGQF